MSFINTPQEGFWPEEDWDVMSRSFDREREEEERKLSSTSTSCCGSCHGTQGCFECPER